MAFQVADDLLDYTEAAATMGKPHGLDLKEHKVTLPLIAALRRPVAGQPKDAWKGFSHGRPELKSRLPR